MASNKTNENKTKRKTTKKVTTKNNVTRKTTAKNHTSGTRKNASQKAEGIPMSSEITLVVAFGLVVLMMFSNFGHCGLIGKWLASFFFGIFGCAQFVMPVFFFLGITILVANDYSTLAMKKCGAGFVILMEVSAVSQLLYKDTTVTVHDLFSVAINNHATGGIIGGGVALLLREGFGTAGAMVVLICVFLLACILLTQRSFVSFFKKMVKNVRASKEEWEKSAEKRRLEREAAAAEDRLINLEEEEESSDKATSFLKMKSGYKKTSDKKRAKQCEEKVKELEEKKEKKNPKKQSSTSAEQEKTIKNIKVNVPVFTSSDEVKRKDCVRELHPQIYPFTEEDGKTEPFKGKLDFSAFTFPEENTSLISEQAQESTLEVQEESYAPPYKEKGSFHTSLPEEIRINEDLGSLIEEVSESIVSEAEAISEENVYPDAADQAIEQKEVPEIEAVKDMKEKQEENEESRIWKNGAEIKQRDTEAKDNASEVNDRDIAIQEKQMARQDTIKKETAQEVSSVESKEVVPDRKKAEGKDYLFPPASLLIKEEQGHSSGQQQYLQETAQKLYETLKSFGVNVTITDISCGPSVTRYEMFPEQGTKVSKILSLTDDIKLNLAASDIRIEAPIPGKAAIGIEIPNKHNQTVHFRDLIESQTFKTFKSKLAFAVGKDISGKTKVTDIAKMPHLLIAGATGSGKSVCINTIIMSILYKARPDEVKLIMIDPKVVELSVYNGIPHLMIPVVTDPKKASGALHWAVAEMTERYEKFAEANVREINGYNAKVDSIEVPEGQERPQKMPQIVIIVDELADLMMVASNDVEEAICRLAQLARAAGIHLVIATQRPSVNVITGLIKANMPSRIAFSVTSGTDSRTILDMNGAEKLLGKGDMLFHPQGAPKPIRVQGAFVSDKEVSDVVEFIKEQNETASYNEEIVQKVDSMQASSGGTTVSISDADAQDDGRDAYFDEAAQIIVDKEKASIGMLQRYLKVGFNRAARIMDQLEEAGIVGPEEGTKPRKVLMTSEELQAVKEDL